MANNTNCITGVRDGWLYMSGSNPGRYIAIQLSRIDMWAITDAGHLTVWTGGTTFSGNPTDPANTARLLGAPSLSDWGTWLTCPATLPSFGFTTPRPIYVQGLFALASVLVPVLLAFAIGAHVL